MTQTKEERKAQAKEIRDRPENKAKMKEKRDRPEEKAKTKIYMKKWREENLEKHRASSRDWANRTRLERKQKVFSHYSNGSLKCACCGVKGLEFLTIDHIISRKTMESDLELMNMGYSAKLFAKELYYWLEKNNFPSGFQILCWNCNFAKGSLGECPHEK
jgi:5-methylcytosine-specific restriction endonuclease McrA